MESFGCAKQLIQAKRIQQSEKFWSKCLLFELLWATALTFTCYRAERLAGSEQCQPGPAVKKACTGLGVCFPQASLAHNLSFWEFIQMDINTYGFSFSFFLSFWDKFSCSQEWPRISWYSCFFLQCWDYRYMPPQPVFVSVARGLCKLVKHSTEPYLQSQYVHFSSTKL